MEKRIKGYSVGQLARASGVSVRTLHHYDAIGLLRPAGVAANGYRSYGQDEALRLQEILFYRAAGLPLADIRAVLDEGDRLARLRHHRDRLVQRADEMAEQLNTLNSTISKLKGNETVALEELYRPFSPEKQAEYEAWLIDTYGVETAAAIKRARANPLTNNGAGAPEAMAELQDIETALVNAMQDGLADPALGELFERHRIWVGKIWNNPCSKEAYAGLAEMYLAHPDFIARYETLAAGFSQWLSRGMKEYVKG